MPNYEIAQSGTHKQGTEERGPNTVLAGMPHKIRKTLPVGGRHTEKRANLPGEF